MPESLLGYLLRERFGPVATTDYGRGDAVAAIQKQTLSKARARSPRNDHHMEGQDDRSAPLWVWSQRRCPARLGPWPIALPTGAYPPSLWKATAMGVRPSARSITGQLDWTRLAATARPRRPSMWTGPWTRRTFGRENLHSGFDPHLLRLAASRCRSTSRSGGRPKRLSYSRPKREASCTPGGGPHLVHRDPHAPWSGELGEALLAYCPPGCYNWL